MTKRNCCYIPPCPACATGKLLKSNKWRGSLLSVRVQQQQFRQDSTTTTKVPDRGAFNIFSCSAGKAFSSIRDTAQLTTLPRSVRYHLELVAHPLTIYSPRIGTDRQAGSAVKCVIIKFSESVFVQNIYYILCEES